MPKRLLPSMTALQCFEAVARHSSATRAAQELHLTQSAVSKKIVQLEGMLQSSLFTRLRKRLQLTPAGELYLAEVRKILNQVEASSRYVQSYGGETEVLTVAAPPTFAARWLVPRLNGFGRRFPNVHLDICGELGPFDTLPQQADIAFYFGAGARPHARCLRLFGEEMVAIGEPGLLDARLPASLPELAQYRLLQVASRPHAWHSWFSAQGMDAVHAYQGPRFATFEMAISAAHAGCGIALVPRFLVEEDIQEGRLAMMSPYARPSEQAYFLAYAEHTEQVPKIRALVEWMQDVCPQAAFGT